MANKTNFLNLILPANNEYNDIWDEPINSNFTKIDEEIEVLFNELQSARFTKTSLAEFLEVAHFSDGTLKPSQESIGARNSVVYGDDDGAGNDFELKDRLDLGDREVWDAREGLSSLIESMARKSRDFDYPDMVINGAKTIAGYPNFLTSSGSEFQLNGDPTPIEMNINGQYMRIADDVNVNVTGSDGTKYLVAQIPSSPFVVLDRSTNVAGVVTTNPLNNDKAQIFYDAGVDFTLVKVKVGMVLKVLNSANIGEYIITEIAPGGNVNQIVIAGVFSSQVGALNYRILDPIRPELSVETAYTPAEGKVIIGEGSFISGALVSSLTYAFKGKYESEYQAIDVSTLPTFEVILNHNLGVIPKSVEIFASQSNTDTQHVEPLSVAAIGSDLVVDIDNTLVFSPGTFSPGTGDSSYSPLPSLVGDVTGSLTGSVYDLRSVRVKFTKTQIFIKNVKANHFYRDYDGTDRDAGFLKVVCKR